MLIVKCDKRARSSIGRAPVLHSGGMEFESPRVHNVKKNDACASFFSCGSHSHISSADEMARRGSEHLRRLRVFEAIYLVTRDHTLVLDEL